MQKWYSASELEAAELQGLPVYRQHITRKAKDEDWKKRPRQGRGGGYEYHFSSLPVEAQAKLLDRFCKTNKDARAGAIEAEKIKLAEKMERRAREARRQESLAELAGLPKEKKREVDAKLQLIERYRAFEEHTNLAKTKLQKHFKRLFDARELELDDVVYEEIDSFSARTLRRWLKKEHEQGPSALAGRYGRRSNRDYIYKVEENAEVQSRVLGMLKNNPGVNAKHVMRALRAKFDEEEVPSVRAVQRYMSTWKEQNSQLYQHMQNPDKYRSTHQVAFGRADDGVTRLNQLWELDSTPADVMLTDGRHSLIGVIDVWSRRLKLHVVRTSSAKGIASLMRRAIMDWGIPDAIRTDQGADYTSKHVRRVVSGLQIEQELCQPFTPEAKPFIERAFRTFSHDIAELLEGFVGHNVAERQAIEARQSFAQRLMKGSEPVEINMTPEELQEFCDSWTDNVYAHDEHGTLGRSPYQQVISWEGPVRRIENPRALDVLLARAPGNDGIRTVTKKGVRINNMYYQAPELVGHMGKKVVCLYDEADAGRMHIFSVIDVEFICIAEAPEITGISRQELAEAARRLQNKDLKESKRELNQQAEKISKGDLIEEIMASRSEQAAKVHRLGGEKEEAYTTDHLDAAARAAEAREEMDAEPELRDTNEEEIRRKIRNLNAEKAKEGEPKKFYKNKFDKWNQLKATRAKRELTDEEKAFMYDYECEIGIRETNE